MSETDSLSVLELLAKLQERHAGTPYEVLVDDLIAALAADTTVPDLRQEIAFRDAEIAALVAERDRLREALEHITELFTAYDKETNPVARVAHDVAAEALAGEAG